MRWLLAAAGWWAPNVLLFLALFSIPKVQMHSPAGSGSDWAAGSVVIPLFLSIFFVVGLTSIRLALHGAPDDARPRLARIAFGLSLAWLALCVCIAASDRSPELGLGMGCFVLWGLGHLLGSRWKPKPRDQR